MSNRQLSETYHSLFEHGVMGHEKSIIFRQALAAPEECTPSLLTVSRLLEFLGTYIFSFKILEL